MDCSSPDDFFFNPIECFPQQICEKIFENLSHFDLLSASLVSSDWYDFIAKTPCCMRKLKLTFSFKTSKNLSPEMKQILIESKRKYENIDYMHQSKVLQDVQDILAVPGRKWKKLLILRINFPSTADAMNFLSVVEPTIEELRLDKVYIDSIYYCDPKKELKFPKLKILEAKYIQTLLYYQAFANTTSLREFHISSGDQSVASMLALHKMFECNKSLKKLSIVTNVFTQYFDKDISTEVGFKLTSLVARDIYNLETKHKENFKMFLHTQMMTLQKLNLGDWMGLDIVEMIFHMPRLKEFTFKGFHTVEEIICWDTLKFHTSQTIETLQLIEVKGRIDILQAFLRATPNTKHLKLYSIKNETLQFVSSTLPNLESLSVDLFEATDFSDKSLFLKLQNFSAKAFNMDLMRKKLQNSKSDERGHFEMLVAQQVKELSPENDEPMHKYCGFSRFGTFRREMHGEVD